MNISQHTFLPVSFMIVDLSPNNQFFHIFGLHYNVSIYNASTLDYSPVIHTTANPTPVISAGKFNYPYNQVYSVRNSIYNPPFSKYTLILY